MTIISLALTDNQKKTEKRKKETEIVTRNFSTSIQDNYHIKICITDELLKFTYDKIVYHSRRPVVGRMVLNKY